VLFLIMEFCQFIYWRV